MTERISGGKPGRDDGAGIGATELDRRLTWIRPFASAQPRGPWSQGAGLEQELVDFHARYERACIED